MSDHMEFSRRDLLRHIGATITLAAAGEQMLSAQDVEHVHQAVADEKSAQKGRYQPKSLNAHEYATLQKLSDLILPADERSPGALAAGAADFIDFLCTATDDMKRIYTGGIAWLDDAMEQRYDGKNFLAATSAQQKEMLDLVAFRENRAKDPSLEPGIQFFSWTRNMVVDAYYTSPIGFKELGYMGNTAMTHFSVPQEAIDYAIKRSPFA
jgi:gluconate 2-dehydrogenase subunit 3-like protein